MANEFNRAIKHLRHDLQIALEVEHATIPPYLCALYSIRDGSNRAASEVIKSVVMEEMLHMVLVANLMNAVGARPRLDYPGFVPSYPSYLPGSDRSFVVPLLKFSPEALEVFMRIEKPEPPRERRHPEDEGYSTIGEFYENIRRHLDELVEAHGEHRVFPKKYNRLQVTPEYYYGGAGAIFPVTDLECAHYAIDEIVEQGEGAPNHVNESFEVRPEMSPSMAKELPADPESVKAARREAVTETEDRTWPHHVDWSGYEEPAHYYRFMEIYEGRYFQKGDTPRTGPRGPEFPVQWDAVYDMRPNPHVNDYPEGGSIRPLMEDFNRLYSRLLRELEAGFNGNQPALGNAVADMYQLKDRAQALMRVPSGEGSTTVGPSFEYVAAESG